MYHTDKFNQSKNQINTFFFQLNIFFRKKKIIGKYYDIIKLFTILKFIAFPIILYKALGQAIGLQCRHVAFIGAQFVHNFVYINFLFAKGCPRTFVISFINTIDITLLFSRFLKLRENLHVSF